MKFFNCSNCGTERAMVGNAPQICPVCGDENPPSSATAVGDKAITSARKNKYGNRHVRLDGYTFDSVAESRRYLALKTLLLAGDISDLVIHPKFVLQEAFSDRWGRHYRPVTYTADFSYTQDGLKIVEDVKGVETAKFKVVSRIFVHKYPDIKFDILPTNSV